MRLFGWGLRNLRRNRRRTLFTIVSLGFSLFLFCALIAVLRTLDATIESRAKLPVVSVLHKSGYTHLLPESHAARMRRIPGVKSVVAMLYYGGTYGEVKSPQDTFPSFGVDAVDAMRTMWGPDLELTDADWQAFLHDRKAVLVGPQLMRKYGWERGRHITLRGTIWPVDLDFTIAGVASFQTDQSSFLAHREYIDQALGGLGGVSSYFVGVDDARNVAHIAQQIESELGQTSDPVRAMSQKEFLISFLGLLGDIRGLIGGIALLVLIASFFVTANAVALSARERTAELAVLRALGFSRADLIGGMIAEAVALAALGGLLGGAAAFGLLGWRSFAVGFGPLSGFRVDGATVLAGLGLSAAVGLLSTLMPAWRAARTHLVDALRTRE
jgi:putative ABC transport system permease protein